MVDQPSNEKKEDVKQESAKKEKQSSTLGHLNKSEKIEDLYQYAKTNTADTIAYVAMILGLLILFVEPFYGGTIIGVITGLYFTKEIMRPVKNLEKFIEKIGMVRSLILGGVILAFFIKLPMAFIAAAVTVAIKQLIYPENKSAEE